jgi:hypothetical protein
MPPKGKPNRDPNASKGPNKDQTTQVRMLACVIAYLKMKVSGTKSTIQQQEFMLENVEGLFNIWMGSDYNIKYNGMDFDDIQGWRDNGLTINNVNATMFHSEEMEAPGDKLTLQQAKSVSACYYGTKQCKVLSTGDVYLALGKSAMTLIRSLYATMMDMKFLNADGALPSGKQLEDLMEALKQAVWLQELQGSKDCVNLVAPDEGETATSTQAGRDWTYKGSLAFYVLLLAQMYCGGEVQ